DELGPGGGAHRVFAEVGDVEDGVGGVSARGDFLHRAGDFLGRRALHEVRPHRPDGDVVIHAVVAAGFAGERVEILLHLLRDVVVGEDAGDAFGGAESAGFDQL